LTTIKLQHGCDARGSMAGHLALRRLTIILISAAGIATYRRKSRRMG
jgi:hypothetical protein